MNSSYNYADFIGMNIDFDSEPEVQDKAVTQQPDNGQPDQSKPAGQTMRDDKTRRRHSLP